ncbi:MAG TPA: AzlC family ABC transporter permease [Salinisphaeraceae bacterium]|nr:AzlC family ABC transporter permease [Salinisphaeraceae bacterium]
MHEQGRNSLWRDFTAGTTAVVPVLLGVVPYALIAGVIAIQVGLTPVQASGMSLLLFAGASQFAAMQLINNGAPALVILVTVLFVNLRMAMYSASIAPHFATTRQTTRALISYLLTDQAYMFSLYGFEQLAPARSRVAYYLGLALPIWLVWQLGTMTGAVLGTELPAGWALDFTLPLIFLALLVPSIRDRATLAAAIVGGCVAVAAQPLPWNLGLIAGALAGIGAGMLCSAPAQHATDS